MDFRELTYVLAIAKQGNITKAAESLYVGQPTLSKFLMSMEDELGLNLLVRSKNGVRLSPAGQALRPAMQAFLDSALDLEEEAAHLRQRSSSTLRLGSYSSIASTWLPAIVASFRKVDPSTDVIIDVGGIPDIYEKLKTDQLDCAFVSYQESLCVGLHYFHLADDPLVAILPDTDSHEEIFPISDFSQQEFLMPSDGFDVDILPLFSRHLGKDLPRIRYTNLSDSAIVSMVEHNLGISLLSELIMEGIHSSVKMLPLDPPIVRKLGIAASDRQHNDKVIRRFIRCAQTVIDEMAVDSAAGVI